MDFMETCLRLRGLTKHYDTGQTPTLAVDGIDLDITRGEIVALLGPNGAGKTTTLDMVLGFAEPTDGHIEVFGQAPRQAVADGRVSAVLQTGGLLRDLTVGETVELIAATYPRVAGPDPVAEVLARTQLTGLADRLVQACSGGEQQRLRFALALLADPDLLVLDEPTAGMDVEARQTFWATMADEAERGRTIVFATHYLQEAEDFARRTVLMANGRVVADGPTDQVRRQASGRIVRARVDLDGIERAAATLRSTFEHTRIELEGDRLTVETPDSDAVARLLLTELGGSSLEIEAASLESAFLRLTARPAAEPETAAESASHDTGHNTVDTNLTTQGAAR
ncbi:MAG: ABC transporter ATP-binding protein [Acidimicrobiales bacterium]